MKSLFVGGKVCQFLKPIYNDHDKIISFTSFFEDLKGNPYLSHAMDGVGMCKGV
jgi:hypothetical protein